MFAAMDPFSALRRAFSFCVVPIAHLSHFLNLKEVVLCLLEAPGENCSTLT